MNRILQVMLTAAIACAQGPIASGSDWEVVDVPGEVALDGYGWYRTWFKPHPSFFSDHERDLWGESVIVNLHGLRGAHEAFVNGTRIGGGGSFPPEYTDGVGGLHRHKIPSGLLVRDRWNELALRVFFPGDQESGGFGAEAPFVMNYFWECILEGPWEFRFGDDASWKSNALESRPGTSAFEVFRESNRVLGEAETLVHGDKLEPRESLARMRPHDDVMVELMLHEPEVAQPTHISFDSKGRLWVAQYRQYPYPAGVRMVSRDRYYRSHYDRTPPPPPHHSRGRDVVSVHEDTDGDGVYDRHSVFQDGLNMANAAVRGRGGVWVMHTPYLLFYPDRDFDDVPDGPPVVHLKGFGLEDSHSVANGLVWGMDGWLYGAQGSTTSCHVIRPGIDDTGAADGGDRDGESGAGADGGVYFQGCMVWRYHPESRRFEIFAEGGGNNFGLEVDAAGRLFTGHNGGGTRGWHYVQGGLHLMQGKTPNKFGPPRNPFAFGDLPKMESEQPIRRFTHSLAVAEGTAIPDRFQGAFLSLDPLHNFVVASARLARGATFRTVDIDQVLESDDPAFRPVYIANAPDGSVLVADFYEHYIAHGQHYQSQIDPTTGRIYRIRAKSLPLERDLDLHAKSTTDLIGFLGHPNKWHRHTAVRLLGERKDPASRTALRALVRRGQGVEALCALWALYQGFGLDQATARIALNRPSSPIRYWAVRFIADDIGFAAMPPGSSGRVDRLGGVPGGRDRVESDLFEAMLESTRSETDAEVRSQMAASARRLPADQALRWVTAVMRNGDDSGDSYIPLLCWWVFEANLDRDRDAVLALLHDDAFRDLPIVKETILERVMRALAFKGRQRDLEDCARLLELATDDEQTDRFLAGFGLAYDGRRIDGLPPRLARALVANGRTSPVLRMRMGDPTAVREAIRTLERGDESVETRLSILRTLGEIQPGDEGYRALINAATAESAESATEIQRAALAALTAIDNPATAGTLLRRFASIAAGARPALFELLLSRMEWTREWVARIDSGALPIDTIPREVAARMASHGDDEVRRIAERRLEAVPGSGFADAAVTESRIRAALAAGEGNPYAGEKTYLQRCAACHRLFQKGGHIGPDLTPYQRSNLETLLPGVLNPGLEIREGYEYVSLKTVDGRELSGIVVDADDRMVTLRGMAGEDVRIERRHVKALEPTGGSMMPDGLLQGLNDQEIRDFFAYLRISQPISR